MNGVAIGTDAVIDNDVTIGYGYDDDIPATRIGAGARIRSGTKIYADVEIGDDFRTGHDALVRENTRIGDDVLVGTDVVIDGACRIGSHVSLQTRSYLPQETDIGDRVFLGPHAVLTNDKHPVRRDEPLCGPTIETGASIGAQATILPDVVIGEDAFVAAGAVVTEDVPPDTLAVGTPARHRELPRTLRGGNQLA